MKSNRLMTSLNSRISYCFYKGFLKKKIRTQYTYQLLSIVLCSTWVNSYLLVILYGELLLNKIAIYGVKTDEVLVLNLTKSKSIHHIIFFQFQLTNFSFSILYIVLDWSNGTSFLVQQILLGSFCILADFFLIVNWFKWFSEKICFCRHFISRISKLS
jgi:hypothetical protein